MVTGDVIIAEAMPIYLDHNATTPLDPAVADAIDRAQRELFGNASSVHRFGQQAKAALDDAREQIAALIGARASDLVLTSGGTEADNFAIRGVVEAADAAGRRHVVASAIEHEAVLNTLKALGRRGLAVTLVPVGRDGRVDPAAIADAITPNTALVSVMHANNETGVVQPVAEIAALARARGVPLHTDAVQSAGKIAVDVGALGVDLLSLSGHKFHGPKGTGALWIRRGTALRAILTGGRHERNRRAGTENVPAVVGFGVAAERAARGLEVDAPRLAVLRDRLEAAVQVAVEGVHRNGEAPRVPNTSNLSFDRVEAESLLIALDLEGIAVSTGSACSSGTLEPSHVLKAMGLAPGRVQSAIRISLGKGTTEAEIDRVATVLPALVARLRGLGRRTPEPARSVRA